MKFATSAAAALTILPHTLATPVSSDSELSQRQPEVIPELWQRAIDTHDFEAREAEAEAEADGLSTQELEKRRGGGGGGRGGSSGSSSGGSSGGSSGSSSGSSSSGGSSSSSSGRGGSSGSSSSGSSSSGSSSSGSSSGSRGGSTGGSTSSSSSASPAYGGGRYYGGGSTSAYSAGSRSPGGILPFAVGGAALGFGAYALWPASVYAYPWHTRYNYHRNGTNRTTTKVRRQDDGTVSLPVTCLCDPDLSCGCDDNGNSTYFDEFLGPNNQTKNATVATIQSVNGTDTVVLNGTLPDGVDDSSDDTSGARMLHVQAGGYTVMSAAMIASLWLL